MDLEPHRVIVTGGGLNVGHPRRIDITSLPGTSYFELWSSGTVPSLPHRNADPAATRGPLRPRGYGNVFRIVRLPPAEDLGSLEEDPEHVRRVVTEYEEAFDVTIDDPKDHSSDTVTYSVVVSGRAVC